MKSSTKPLLRALIGEPVATAPFWLMRQAGRYLPEYRATRSKAANFVELCLTPDLAAEITLQPIRRFGMDGAILFSDILMVPYALGQKLAFQEGEGPKLEPIRDSLAFQRLASKIELAKLEPVYETIRRVSAELPPTTTLLGFAGAPWTLATYVVEGGSSRAFEHVKRWAADDPESFALLIDRLTDAVIDHLDAQIAAGVEAVQLFDSWASAALDQDFERWVLAPAKKIAGRLKEKWPDVPMIGFPKSIGPQYERYATSVGCAAVSIDPELSLDFARDRLQPHVAVQGNLDPMLLVAGGEAMDDAIRTIVATLGRGRFVFNLGHGVVPQTPPQHVQRVADLLRSIPLDG